MEGCQHIAMQAHRHVFYIWHKYFPHTSECWTASADSVTFPSPQPSYVSKVQKIPQFKIQLVSTTFIS